MALEYVPEHGWSQKALSAGAEAVGLPGVAHGLFPRGGIQLISYFYVTCNSQLSEQMAAQNAAEEHEGPEKQKTVHLIRDSLVSRLSMIHPYIDHWPQAMAIMTLPQNAIESWGNLAQLTDNIWHYAGDTSVDISWYTKRLSLAVVYKTTELYMLQDRSGDYSNTWDFLDRRLSDVATVGKTISTTQQTSDVLLEGIIGAYHVGRNIFGLNARQR